MSGLSFHQFLERIAEGKPATLHICEDRAEACPMRVRCGWCKRILIAGDPPESTGICDECAVAHGYADQEDVLNPEGLTSGEIEAEVAAAMERCLPAVEAAAFPGSLQDAVAAGVARSVGRAAVWIAGGLVIGVVNTVGLYVVVRAALRQVIP